MSDVSEDKLGGPGDSTELSPGDAEPSTAAPTHRPTPAASAASRARRIGGATGTRKAPPVPAEPALDSSAEPVSAADGDESPGTGSTGHAVSMRKRLPRSASARGPKADSGPAAATQVPGWLRWAPAAVLSACAIAMIIIIAVAAHGVWYAKPSTSAERDKVLAAAKRCMAAANTYNYKTLAADEKRGLACTTGAWTTQYKSALEKIVKPTATQLKASQTVQINAAGVEAVSDNGRQWTTIVYGQLTINQANATPRIDPFAAVVRLDKVKSSYLVSKIDLITNPNA